jgi:type IV pilus assembly protein PilA
VSEAAPSIGSMPAVGSVSFDSMSSKWVLSSSYTSSGVITATAQGDSKISGSTIVMTGALGTNGQVTWTCGGTIDPKFRPASCK